MAVCLLEIGARDEEKQEAAKVLEKVPGLRQKIAGKSIPLEVSLYIYIHPLHPLFPPRD